MQSAWTTADPRMTGLKLYVGLLLLLFIASQTWLFRHRLSRLFRRWPTDPAKLEEVRAQLDEIHEESPLHIFTAKRATEILLRGHPIVVAHGTVSVPSAKGSSTTLSVFSIAEGDETEWMKHFPDVFEVAFTGKRFTVFWVKLPVLIRLSEQHYST